MIPNPKILIFTSWTSFIDESHRLQAKIIDKLNRNYKYYGIRLIDHHDLDHCVTTNPLWLFQLIN